MNWLETLINRQASAWRFNPWRVLVWPDGTVSGADTEGGTGHARATQPGTVPQPSHTPTPALQSLATEPACAPVAPPCFEDETDHNVLGIGACVALPWQFHMTEDNMQNTPRTICVSDRDLGPMRVLVASALNTYSDVTLEYVRLLSSELCQATVLPLSRLPCDTIALNSRVWITDLDSGEKMIVTLVLPDHVDGIPDRISVISPLGMALFGYGAGDRLEWGPVQRPIRLKVDRVRRIRSHGALYQPHRQLPCRNRKDQT